MVRKSLTVVLLSLFIALLLGAFPMTAQGEPVTVRWFVGLGAGGQPPQIDAQNAVVEEFNASRDDIQIEIQIVDNNVAYDTLSTLIAAGDAPDIVGPVGVRGSNAYSGSWLDLQPLVDSSGYDLSQFPQAAVDFYRVEGEGLIGLPFAVFPSFLWYNVDLFDEAGLDYPPEEWGAPYADGDEWNMDKLRELAMLLTVDENGNDATSPDFDPENVVQWGFESQWNDDSRAQAALFGAANYVDENGNAVIPENWRAAFRWYYDGIWTDRFIPNSAEIHSDLLGNDGAFASGNIAIAHTHLWYTCCVGEVNFGIAALPSYNGVITAKLHADTFRILNTTENPEAAFEVLTYLIGDASDTLLQVYGGMPARPTQQESFFATLSETFPGVNWQVAVEGLNYADNPSSEANMPNFNEADQRSDAFWTLYESTPGLDIDAELDILQADLQAIFEGGTFDEPTPEA